MLLHYPYGGRHVVTHAWTAKPQAQNRKPAERHTASPHSGIYAHHRQHKETKLYRMSIEHIEHLSNVYRTSIEHLSNIYQTSIEHRSSTCRTYRESIDAPGGGNNNNNKDNDKNIEKNQPPPPNRPVPPFPPKLCMVSPTKIFYRTSHGHLMEIN